MDQWLSELNTRCQIVDVLLTKQGWDVKDTSKVMAEIDTKQSNFPLRKYLTVADTLKNNEESKYADYLLLDKNGDPLAIIEVKRTNKDPIIGQKQAEGYAEDIYAQTKKNVFIYFTNGYEIWFWNKPYENPRMVKGFHGRDSLERIRFQNQSKKPLKDIPIRSDIVDRDYQIEAVKRVTEGIERGKRKFLLVHDPNKIPIKWDGWIIHGDKHDNDIWNHPFINGEKKTINVCAELVNYQPLDLEKLLKLQYDKIKRMDTINTNPEYF